MATVLLLLVVGASVLMVASLTGRQSGLVSARTDTVRAFYAAEAGLHLAVRELTLSQDEDGDGVVGGIASDGLGAGGRMIGTGEAASVRVFRASVDGSERLMAEGRAGDALRRIEITLTPSVGGTG